MDPLESFARYTPDAHHYERCPHCQQCTLRWSHRWPEDIKKPLQTQWYLCDRCGLIPLAAGLDEGATMRRCWHCSRWGVVAEMIAQATMVTANRKYPVTQHYCSKRCALRERIAERRELRLMGSVNYCKGLVYQALRKFLED